MKTHLSVSKTKVRQCIHSHCIRNHHPFIKKGHFSFWMNDFFFCKSKNREIHMIRLTEVINEFTTFSPADQVLFLGC